MLPFPEDGTLQERAEAIVAKAKHRVKEISQRETSQLEARVRETRAALTEWSKTLLNKQHWEEVKAKNAGQVRAWLADLQEKARAMPLDPQINLASAVAISPTE